MNTAADTRPQTRRLFLAAIAYALLGTAGLALAIPPSYASPVFPASGLALVLALWYGRTALAGIWLGSLAMHVLAPPYIQNISLTGTLLAIAIATGATLQAWSGSSLIGRWQGKGWLRLASEKESLRFLLLGGPVACLASASVGISSLYAAGAIADADFLHSWWTWYVGDTLGVLLFGPLTLFFLGRSDPLWQSRARTMVAPMMVILGLVVFVFYQAARLEERDQRRQIEDQSAVLKNLLALRFDAKETMLAALARFMESSPEASLAQFNHFTEPTLKNHPELLALSFNYLVAGEHRSEFERRIKQRLGGIPYGITEKDEAGHIIPAQERREYVAVGYIAPLAINRPALGYDIASDAMRRDAVTRARVSGRMAVTAPISLVQENGKIPGFLALIPAYPAASRDRPLGYAVAVINVDQLVHGLAGKLSSQGIVFQLEDPAAPPDRRLMYRSDGGKDSARKEYATISSLSMGDRQWNLSVFPTAHYLQQHRPWMAWTVGVAGLLFATVLQLLVLVITARAALIKQKVEEQTAEILDKSLALQASEERYRRLFDGSRVAMLLMDPADDAIVDANQAAADYYGYSRNQLKRLNLSDIRHTPENGSQVPAGIGQNEERTHRLADGSLRQVEVRSGPIEIDGRPLIHAIIADITDRKRLEAEVQAYQETLEVQVADRTAQLAASESNTRLILESTADGLYGLDMEGRISFLNPAACRILGYPAEALVGCHAHTLVAHSRDELTGHADEDFAGAQSLHQGIVATENDDLFRHADGHSVPVLWASHPMVRDGQIIGAVVSFLDITERKALEQAREAALREAERLAKVKSEFLANMSHEIRTPLNGVLGMAQVGFRQNQGRRAQEHFARILDSGRLLLAIVNDILDFSKIEAGKLKIEHLPFDPAKVLERAAAVLAERAQAKGLTLTVDKAADIPHALLGDSLRIEQILVNLLSNAVKFTDHGRVTLRVKRLGSQLLYQVTDTGIGMTASQTQRAFVAFEQADGSTTRKFGGTGLGLTISRRLADLMGGSIRAESEPGQGSTFELILPCLEVSPQELTPRVAKSALPGKRLDGISVLAAEDNLVNQFVLEDFLVTEGAQLVMVSDGQEAVDRIREDGPDAYDIVLMDIQMPGLDGLAATRQILELAPDMPIIGQTAHALAEERSRSLAAGMLDQLTKPLEIEDVVAMVVKYSKRHESA